LFEPNRLKCLWFRYSWWFCQNKIIMRNGSVLYGQVELLAASWNKQQTEINCSYTSVLITRISFQYSDLYLRIFVCYNPFTFEPHDFVLHLQSQINAWWPPPTLIGLSALNYADALSAASSLVLIRHTTSPQAAGRFRYLTVPGCKVVRFLLVTPVFPRMFCSQSLLYSKNNHISTHPCLRIYSCPDDRYPKLKIYISELTIS